MPELTPEKWKEIERLYRAGGATLRGLASQFGVSATTIQRRKIRERWDETREQTQPIVRALAAQLVEGSIVITDNDIISAAAIQAEVTRDHRAGTKRLRDLVGDLGDELSIYLALIRDLRQNPPALTEEGNVDVTDERMKKARLMLAVMGNPIDGVKALAQALRHMIIADRLIHGIDTQPGGANEPDAAALVLAKMRAWDSTVAEEMAKRPYLLAKPAPPPGANGHANGALNGKGNGAAH